MNDSIQETLRPLIIGSKGQLGQALMKLAPNAVGLWREQVDLSRSDLHDVLSSQLNSAGPICGVINAAAYTAVDKAESEMELANKINGDAPGQIALFCADMNLPFVHISTDYVFPGDAETPYLPNQKTAPINAYGQSKRNGEVAIQATDATTAILRTSWVYDGVNGNFLTTMLRLAETRDALSIVGDQIGRPTFTTDLALAALRTLSALIEDPSKSGMYHLSNTGDAISWAEFASAIFAAAGKNVAVTAIPSVEYPTPAARPAYSVMDTSKFETVFDHVIPDWKDGLARALAERPA